MHGRVSDRAFFPIAVGSQLLNNLSGANHMLIEFHSLVLYMRLSPSVENLCA